MKKRIYVRLNLDSKGNIKEPHNKNIVEHLVNTGRINLEYYPPTYEFTHDIFAVLKKHGMIDAGGDDRVEFSFKVDC